VRAAFVDGGDGSDDDDATTNTGAATPQTPPSIKPLSPDDPVLKKALELLQDSREKSGLIQVNASQDFVTADSLYNLFVNCRKLAPLCCVSLVLTIIFGGCRWPSGESRSSPAQFIR